MEEPKNNGALDKFIGNLNEALASRFVMLFFAAALGTGGSVGLQSISTEVRKDPFTGTMGKELRAFMMAYTDKRVEGERAERLVDVDNVRQYIIDHDKASDGYRQLIREHGVRIDHLEKAIERMERLK